MTITGTELKDLGLYHKLMINSCNTGKHIKIGGGKYVVTDILIRYHVEPVYKLMRINK